MDIKTPINWTATRSRCVAPDFDLVMGGVRLQDAAVATAPGSHTWRPPIT